LVRYVVVIEKGPTSYGAYVPDLPGCVGMGKTAAEVKKLIAETVPLHMEGLREDGLPIPDPATGCEYVEVRFLRGANVEAGAAPDRGRITAFQGSTSHRQPRQVSRGRPAPR
jgi:predicted RNase H-like HicB family nuclease